MPVEIDAASLAGARRLPASRFLLARLGDERLIDQLHRGNEAAFEVIYDRHHRSLLSFCAHMLGSRESGEEAVQHSFMSAYRAVVADGKKPRKLRAWLFAIGRNQCVSVLRSRREEHPMLGDELPAATASPSAEAEQRAEMRELVADIRELPEDQRAALLMSQLEDLSHAEVAQALDCPASKVKSLVFQARSALLEHRAARELPCDEVREEVANLRRLPRGGRVRRHVRQCDGCAAFAEDVRRQRQVLALALPIVPSAGLKRTVLASIGGIGGGGGAGGGLAAGGAAKIATTSGATSGLAAGAPAAGGGLTAALTGGGIAKLATVTLAAGSLAAGAVTAGHGETSGRSSDERAAHAARDDAPAERTPVGQDGQENRADRRERRSERSAKGGGNGRRAHGRPSGNPAAGPPESPPGAGRGGAKANAPARSSRPAHAGSGGQPPAGKGSGGGAQGGGSSGSGGHNGGGGSSPNLDVPVNKPRVSKPPKLPDSKLDDALRDAPSLP